MRAKLWTLIAVCCVAVLLTLPAVAGDVVTDDSGADPGFDLFVRISEPELQGHVDRMALSGLWPGDRVSVSGSGNAVLVGSEELAIEKTAGPGGETRWQAVSGTGPQAALILALDDLLPGQSVALSVERPLADGSRAQVNRMLIRDDDNRLLLGPENCARIFDMVRLVPAAGADTTGLKQDARGHIELAAGDPRLAKLQAGATAVQPFISSQVMSTRSGWKILDSVTRTASYPGPVETMCPSYKGIFVDVTSAPAGSKITSMNVTFRVQHTNWNNFKTALFYNLQVASRVMLYHGGQSGSGLMESTVSGLTDYNGWEVNSHYTVATCESVSINTANKLTYFQITLFYGAPGTTDIVADSISLDASSVAAGNTVSLTYNGHIGGTASTGGPFIIGFYLSNDNNITTSDTLLSQLTESAAADPGDTFGASGYSVQIPGSTTPGSYFLGMLCDGPNTIVEIDGSNNDAWAALTVTASGGGIDLVANSVTTSAGSVAAGGTVTVTYNGSISGSGSVGNSFVISIYLSSDNNITTSDTLLGQRTESSATNPGDTFSASVPVTIPVGTAAGSYFVGIFVDSGGAVSESNDNNNKKSTALTVTSGGSGSIDLVAACLSVEDSIVQAGQTIPVSYLVLVSGSGSVGDTFRIGFLLSIDDNITNSDIPLHAVTGVSLSGPGDTFSNPGETVQIPASQAPGTYYLGIFVDQTDKINEASEENNIATVQIVVDGGVLYIPAAAHTAGVGGSQWRTDVEIRPLGGGAAGFTIALLKKGQNNSSPQQFTASIAAGKTRRYPDSLGNLFSFEGSGAIRITADWGQVTATSRTYNNDPGGTYGQYIAAFPEHEAISYGEKASIIQLSRSPDSNTGYRTNIGFVNTSSGFTRIKVQLYLANGTAVGNELIYDLPAYGYNQVTDIFGTVLDDWINDGFAVLWTTTPTGAFFAYASVVDNQSGDAIYIPAQKETLARKAAYCSAR